MPCGALRLRPRPDPSGSTRARAASAAVRARQAALPPRSGAHAPAGRPLRDALPRTTRGRPRGARARARPPPPGCVRVMREARQIAIAAPPLEQRCERDTMKASCAGGRDRLLDGQSGELVPERDVPVGGDEHTRGDALVESRVDRAGERLEQPRLGVRRRDRNGVEHVSRAGREAARSSENGVANRRGDLRSTGSEHLRHEECVAGGRAVEFLRVDPVWLGESSDCDRGEGRKWDAAKGDGRCELTDHEPQRVARSSSSSR